MAAAGAARAANQTLTYVGPSYCMSVGQRGASPYARKPTYMQDGFGARYNCKSSYSSGWGDVSIWGSNNHTHPDAHNYGLGSVGAAYTDNKRYSIVAQCIHDGYHNKHFVTCSDYRTW